MTERRSPVDDRAPVAVADAPSATEAYLSALAALQREEARLQALTQRHQAGEPLTVEERLDRHDLPEVLARRRQALAAATTPMQTEQRQLDVEDVCAVANSYCASLTQAFEDLVAALAAPHGAVQAFLEACARKDQALIAMPAYQHVSQALPPEHPLEPSGREQVANMLRALPNGQALVEWLLAPTSGPLSLAQIRQMQSLHVSAQPMQPRHLARRLARRRGEWKPSPRWQPAIR